MTAKKPIPMCCVSIGYDDYLMPANMGMKVVEMMQSAIRCERAYQQDGHRYRLKDGSVEVSYRSVSPSQIAWTLPESDSAPSGPRRARKPLALE